MCMVNVGIWSPFLVMEAGARTPSSVPPLDAIRLRVTVVVEGLCGRLRAWAR